MELLIIRHLPTQYNYRGVLQGRLDSTIEPPNPAQRLKITENQRRIRQAGALDKVLCSDLKRTAQTALAYGYNEEACIHEPLLNELDFGCYEGLPRQVMLNTHGTVWYQHPQDLLLGEPVIALQHRISVFFEKYAEAERLLLFTHGAWTRALLSYIQTGSVRDMNQMTVDNNDLLYLTLV